jgi:hypothetical protein
MPLHSQAMIHEAVMVVLVRKFAQVVSMMNRQFDETKTVDQAVLAFLQEPQVIPAICINSCFEGLEQIEQRISEGDEDQSDRLSKNQ